MTLNFTIEKEDHLIYQLFQASQSERIKKKRRRNWLLAPVSYLVFGGILYFLKDISYLIAFAALAGVWFVTYPFYSRWLYKNHYARHIEENYRQSLGLEIMITLSDEELYLKDQGSEGRIKLSELARIIDLGSHVFLSLRGGNGVILPRERLQPDHVEAFLNHLEELTGLEREVLNWKWS